MPSHYYSALPEDPESNFDKLINSFHRYPYSYICFGDIGSHFVHGEDFCFGFDIETDIAEKFCNDFNSQFKNIQLKIVYSKTLYRYYNSLGGEEYYLTPQEKKAKCPKIYGDRHVKKFTVFTCKFNGHSSNVQFVFYPIIGELARTYCHYYDQYFNRPEFDRRGMLINGAVKVVSIAHTLGDNLFQKAWEIDQRMKNNCILIDMDYKYLLEFDNPEFVNEVFKCGSKYQMYYTDFDKLIYPTSSLSIIRDIKLNGYSSYNGYDIREEDDDEDYDEYEEDEE